MRKFGFFAILFCGANLAIAQQTLVLNNGQILHGRYDGGNPNTVNFIDEHGDHHRFNITEVQNLLFQNSPPPAPAPRYAPMAQPDVRPAEYEDANRPPDASWNRTSILPAGTEIVVRTEDRIDASAADPQHRFLASIQQDIVDANGNVVIPRGAAAHLIVVNAGDGRVAIDLRSVRVNGQRYVLNAQDLTNNRDREGVGANERTGKFVGGGAIFGGILGAIAGGGKGAAIGAVAGGAAGAGAEIATSGPRVHVPSEAILRFRLDRPVNLYQ